MTDDEFEVLDELYFVQSFEELVSLTGMPADDLALVLKAIYEKGWINILKNVDEELSKQDIDFPNLSKKNYFFLATKNGLTAHNS